uniref:Uncharacterized protein n=1 Tax=Ditylenchus dipsaci TaxID=166011 RepID=A0A915DDB4_9BILA
MCADLRRSQTFRVGASEREEENGELEKEKHWLLMSIKMGAGLQYPQHSGLLDPSIQVYLTPSTQVYLTPSTQLYLTPSTQVQPHQFKVLGSGKPECWGQVNLSAGGQVLISMDRVVIVHTQRIGARTAPITYTDDGRGCYVWTKIGRTSTKNRIEQGYFRCSGCQARNESSANKSKVASLTSIFRLQHGWMIQLITLTYASRSQPAT